MGMFLICNIRLNGPRVQQAEERAGPVPPGEPGSPPGPGEGSLLPAPRPPQSAVQQAIQIFSLTLFV